MKKSVLLVVAIMLAAINTRAQIHFEPGYFINNQGTKTEALIKNLDWKNCPVAFDYKTSESAEVITTTIKEVQEFGVSNFIFKRYTVNVDRSPNDPDNMSPYKEPAYMQETIYIDVLVAGKATLYKYEDGNLTRFFYSKDANAPQQLVYKPYKEGNNILYNNSFRGQLYPVMSDKITDKNRYKNTAYNEKDLTKLFTEYNGDTTQQVKNNESAAAGTSFHIKITPGAEFNAASIDQRTSSEASFDFDIKPSFRIGIEGEWVMPFNKGKWALFAEPYYSSYKNTGKESYNSGADEIINTWSLSCTYIALPLGVRHYMFFNDNSSLFISAAYSNAFVIGKDSKAVFNYSSRNAAYQLEADARSGSGFAFGAGYRYKRYTVEGRYNTKKELLANYAEWTATLSSVSVILGYTIF